MGDISLSYFYLFVKMYVYKYFFHSYLLELGMIQQHFLQKAIEKLVPQSKMELEFHFISIP